MDDDLLQDLEPVAPPPPPPPIPVEDNSEEISRILASLKKDGTSAVPPESVLSEKKSVSNEIQTQPLHEVDFSALPPKVEKTPESKGQTELKEVAKTAEISQQEKAPISEAKPVQVSEDLLEYYGGRDWNKPVAVRTAKKVFGIFITLLPYIVVFAIGVAGYYLFLADKSVGWDITKIWKSEVDPVKKSEESRLKLLKSEQSDQEANFNKWIKQYFFAVTDKERLAMDTQCPNGLTNFENYLLKLNPKVGDANGNGKKDALDVLAGINPETGKPLSDNQKDTFAKFFSPDELRARLVGPTPTSSSHNWMIRGPETAHAQEPQVAGASATSTLPQPTASNSANPSPSVKPQTLVYENKYKINTKLTGKLEIASLNINVPIVWTQDTANFDRDLKQGIVHHPETPLPGDIGTSYISGHSSNYLWVKADFNKVFERLNDLPMGAVFKVTVTNSDGKQVKLYYTVDSKQIYKADDQSQFINYADSRVALSTCWPIGTLDKRLVVFGKLTRVEE